MPAVRLGSFGDGAPFTLRRREPPGLPMPQSDLRSVTAAGLPLGRPLARRQCRPVHGDR